MSATVDQWAAPDFAPPAPNIRFRDGTGGEVSPEWAAHMLGLWYAARDKKLSFAEAVKATAVHFMVGEQQ